MPVHKKVVHHAKHVLIPHKDNEYRPHLIRAHGLMAVVVIAALLQVGYSFVTTGHFDVLGNQSRIQVADLLTQTNQAREADDLPDLVLNDDLSQAAFLKAQDMLDQQYWAHTSPGGIPPWKWFADVGYNYSYAGENLAKNYPTAQATVDAWMGSETHRANILNREYVDVGFAVVDGVLDDENTTLVVAMYGAPVTLAAVQSASSTQAGFSAPAVNTEPTSFLAYVSSAFVSMSPMTMVILGLFVVVAFVAAIAHHFRHNLPKAWQNSWRKHHGMYVFWGVIALGAMLILATGGGQI